jgi:hypothetical protein
MLWNIDCCDAHVLLLNAVTWIKSLVASMSILPGIYNEKSPLSLEEIDSGALRSIYGNPTQSSKAFPPPGLSLYSSHSTKPSPPHPSLLPGEEALAISWVLG